MVAPLESEIPLSSFDWNAGCIPRFRIRSIDTKGENIMKLGTKTRTILASLAFA